MAHVHTLPPELLALIFSAAYNDAEMAATSLLLQKSHELLDILLVCRFWNDVACQISSLWTTVHVAHDQNALKRAQTYANRAGYHGIDVVVTSMSEDVSAQTCGLAFHDLLLGRSHRVRSITIPFSPFHICQALYTQLPNLVSLTYIPISPHDKRLTANSRPGDVNLDAPKLDTLVLYTDTVTFDRDEWPSLQNLEYHHCSGNEEWLWGILGASQRTLKTLVLSHPDEVLVMRQGYPFYLSTKIILCTSMSNLTSLRILGGQDPAWTTLRFADMPALTSLTVELDWFPDPWDQETSLPTFESLQLLSLTTSTADDIHVTLAYLLQFTPNITSLTVTDNSDNYDAGEGHLIEPLLLPTGEDAGQPLFCQYLEEINILGVATPSPKLKELVALRHPQIRKIRFDGGLYRLNTLCSGKSK